MIERYHLALALVALVVGLAVALADRLGPPWLAARTTGAVLAVAAVVAWGDTGAGAPGAVALAMLAAVFLVVADGSPPEHPLGRWVVPMAWVSLVGVWAGVPDTEVPVAALAALGPLACERALGRRGVGRVGWASLSSLVVVTAWVGAAGWGAARATACAVGVVLVAPLALGLAAAPVPARRAVLLAALHVPYALVMPRWVMRLDVLPATAIAVTSLALLAAGTALVGRSSGTAEPVR